MKKSILLFSTLLLFACNNKKSKEQKQFKSTTDSIRYTNYVKLVNYKNNSHTASYVVVNVKNLNTNEIKEICTYPDFIYGALRIENKKNDDKVSLENIKQDTEILLQNKERYFEFKDTAALNNIGFNSYSKNDLAEFKNRIKFDSLMKLMAKKEYPTIVFGENHNELNIYAHLLFNEGIMSIHRIPCSFQIIDDNFLVEREKEIKKYSRKKK
ncbi:MAG: hypothetical protein O9282_06270 [Flavobacterium sp.]|uniref:hypothetical protein n=1 Tax=Flavobacterium sp. TaxID=239 RepID=UPI0022BBA99C|nr:hypothetical protein [Flavobacterium sp.]MCZ8330898.1 hypothetical protein [Flavobacterium sp.]